MMSMTGWSTTYEDFLFNAVVVSNPTQVTRPRNPIYYKNVIRIQKNVIHIEIIAYTVCKHSTQTQNI